MYILEGGVSSRNDLSIFLSLCTVKKFKRVLFCSTALKKSSVHAKVCAGLGPKAALPSCMGTGLSDQRDWTLMSQSPSVGVKLWWDQAQGAAGFVACFDGKVAAPRDRAFTAL